MEKIPPFATSNMGDNQEHPLPSQGAGNGQEEVQIRGCNCRIFREDSSPRALFWCRSSGGQQGMHRPRGSRPRARSSYLSVDALQELQLLPQETHSHLQLLLGQVQTVHVLERHHVLSEKR